MTPRPTALGNIYFWLKVAGVQAVFMFVGVGMHISVVQDLRADMEKHEDLPYHGTVGVDLATLTEAMNNQVKSMNAYVIEQRYLVSRINELVDRLPPRGE